MKEKILVTGGGGFLGSAICRQLQSKGYEVLSFSRKKYPELEQLGIRCVEGSVLSKSDLESAMQGCEGIIHTAAQVGSWGDPDDFYKTNVIGTQNVIAAAQKMRVGRMVFTSSPSVVFSGKDICGADESLPYAHTHLGSYSYTKMLAEQKVLNAHGEQYLATTAIRPHLIWGPGDPHFVPRIRELAPRLRKLGARLNKVDVTYIDNAAEAHVLALEELSLESPNGGKAYFVGQERPIEIWEFINGLLDSMGMQPVRRSVPSFPVLVAAFFVENYYRLRRIYDREPPLTRFVALNLARSCYFSHKQAQHDFHYSPRVSIEEGFRNLKSSLAEPA